MEMMTGRCHCGHIKYEAQGPIVNCSYCDCPGCQRATGTLQAPFVVVRDKGLKLTAAEPAQFRSTSGAKCDSHGVWHFCPKCGSHVFWKSDGGTNVDLFAGSLDDTSVVQPQSEATDTQA